MLLKLCLFFSGWEWQSLGWKVSSVGKITDFSQVLCTQGWVSQSAGWARTCPWKKGLGDKEGGCCWCLCAALLASTLGRFPGIGFCIEGGMGSNYLPLREGIRKVEYCPECLWCLCSLLNHGDCQGLAETRAEGNLSWWMTFNFQTSAISCENTKKQGGYGVTKSSVSKGTFQKNLILRQH